MQLNHHKNKFIRDKLAAGIIPTNFEITQSIQQCKEKSSFGLPTFKPIKQMSGGLSSAAAYNQNFQQIGHDLMIAYQANALNNKKAIESEENQTIERNKIFGKVKELKLRLKFIEEALLSGSVAKHVTHTFNDFYNVDFDGDSVRNIPKTTAFVDLNGGYVTLDRLTQAINKYDISNANVTLIHKEETSTSGSINNLFKTTVNETFSMLTETNNNGTDNHQIWIELKNQLEANHFSVLLSSAHNIIASVRLIDANDQEELLYDQQGVELIEWSFNARKIKKIGLTLKKTEPDGLDERGVYYYLYVLKDFSLSLETTKTNGVFVSRPISLDKLPNLVTLKANATVFKDTEIKYYLGIDQPGEIVDWVAVKNKQSIDLNLLESKSKHYTGKAQGFGSVFEANRPLYRVGDLPTHALTETVQLKAGCGLWRLDVMNYSNTSLAGTYLNLNTISLDELKNLPNVACKTYFLHPSKSLAVSSDELHILTQYVYANQDAQINGCGLVASTDQLNQLSQRVFVNGTEVLSHQSQTTVRLRKGFNKVQIAIALKQGDRSEVLINYPLKDSGRETYALKPLKEVPLAQLRTMSTDYSCYAIYNRTIIVNHPPKNLTTSRGPAGIPSDYVQPYRVDYQVNHDKTKSFTNTDTTLRVMAVLSTNHSDFAPILSDYQLIVE